ncbi:arginase family protein [Paraferrimonas sedimenticola]|uniref:Agmatinase n=1 Tax=Paraferrimonas sedimenticola TaxID=375674 RepID=A0AA37RW93_9GAMM|nr:arginase family protein [Paraferrimonas sedimenticola]GLP96396.1 agmatinase [Paraferrimonas sedimenticola]
MNKLLLPVLFAFSVTSAAAAIAAESDGGIPYKWAPWKDPNNPLTLKMTEEKDVLFERRDQSAGPKREPGLYYPNRYNFGPTWTSIPTFLGAPIAQTPADLKAGKVDIAMFGMTVGDQMLPGGRFAALQMRSLIDYLSYPAQGEDQFIGVDIGKLVMADYGNAAANWMADNQINLDEVHKIVSEIISADAIPVGIGGTHIQSYGFMTALAEKYGPGEVAVIHIDAHYDAYKAGAGRFVHNGSFMKLAVEKGVINGNDIIQVGLRGSTPGAYDLNWMRKNKLRFHFQAEIEKNGWDAVMAKVLEEVKGRKVYVTFDMDGVDPAYAPGVGTAEPDGLTAGQAIQLMRALGIQNEIVAAEFNEYNPFLDDAHQTTGILMDRLIRSLLAGIQGRREGITDPYYYDPERINHGSD